MVGGVGIGNIMMNTYGDFIPVQCTIQKHRYIRCHGGSEYMRYIGDNQRYIRD